VSEVSGTNGNQASVAFIVVVKNAKETLRECLDSIAPQCRRDQGDRLIVIDNVSTDGSREIAEGYADEVVTVDRGPIGFIRNEGASKGAERNEILAYFDADCLMPEHWRDAIVNAVPKQRDAVHGCRYLLPTEPHWIEKAWTLSTPLLRKPTKYVPGGCLIVTPEVFDQIGRFDEVLESGEDQEICRRARSRGITVVEDPDLAVVHLGNPKSLHSFFRQQRWHGRGARLRYPDGTISYTTLGALGSSLCGVGALGAFIAGLASGATAWLWLAGALAAGYLAPIVFLSLLRCGWRINPIKFFPLIPVVAVYLYARTLGFTEKLLQSKHLDKRR